VLPKCFAPPDHPVKVVDVHARPRRESEDLSSEVVLQPTEDFDESYLEGDVPIPLLPKSLIKQELVLAENIEHHPEPLPLPKTRRRIKRKRGNVLREVQDGVPRKKRRRKTRSRIEQDAA